MLLSKRKRDNLLRIMRDAPKTREETPQGRTPEATGSLLFPGLSAVLAAPDFAVTGGKHNLRRTADIADSATHINVSYVGAKLLGFDGRLHLRPSYSAVGGVEKCTRLPASPYILALTCVAQQWMIRAQGVLPALAVVRRPLQDTPGNHPGDAVCQRLAHRGCKFRG